VVACPIVEAVDPTSPLLEDDGGCEDALLGDALVDNVVVTTDVLVTVLVVDVVVDVVSVLVVVVETVEVVLGYWHVWYIEDGYGKHTVPCAHRYVLPSQVCPSPR